MNYWISSLALLGVALTGCTTYTGYYNHAEYKPVAYQTTHSKAWNIANAAGIHLDDLDIPEQQIKKNQGESVSDKYARANALHGLGGLGWFTSSLLGEAFAPTSVKDSANEAVVIYFQPESKVRAVTGNVFPNKPQDQIAKLAADEFEKAVRLALNDLNKQYPSIKPVFLMNKNISRFEKDSMYSVSYSFEEPNYDCHTYDEAKINKELLLCEFGTNFVQAANEQPLPLPSFTGFNEKGYALVAESMAQEKSAGSKIFIMEYSFNTKIKDIPDFKLPEKFVNKYLTAHELALLISKYMPQGMYIYLSALPETINGKVVKFPQMILDHGEILYFVKPK